MATTAITGSEIIDEFVKAGLVPENCQRIVIDMGCDRVVTMYYQTMPNGEKLKEVGLADKILKGGLEIKCAD